MSPDGMGDAPTPPRVGMSVDQDLYRHATFHIWGATNRIPTQDRRAPWLTDLAGPLTLGTLQVPHPALGKAGDLRWETHTDQAMWQATLRTALAVGSERPKRLLVLVHGFANDLACASGKARYLRAHLQHHEVLLFSWPSKYVAIPFWSKYKRDRVQALQAVPALRELLHEVLGPLTNEVDCDIVVHSLGSEMVLRAVPPDDAAPSSHGIVPKFRHIVFIAPDVDAQEFEALIGPVVTRAAKTTLYGHDKDRALIASGTMNYRLGDAPTDKRAGDFTVTLRLPGVEQVNLCELTSSWSRHNEALTDDCGMRDVIALLENDLPAEKRPMMRPELKDRDTPTGRYVLLTVATL